MIALVFSCLGFAVAVQAQEKVGAWRLVDPKARELVESIDKDRADLKQLIQPGQIPATESIGGFQLRPSATVKAKKTARIRFEFPHKVNIDAIAIYPVVRPTLDGPRSLGMPSQLRFLFDFDRQPGQIKINLGPQPSSEPPRYVVHDNAAPTSPLPMLIEFETRSVKSLTLEVPRLALISHNPQDGSSLYGCMFAEIEIYDGEVNLAHSAKLTASDSLEREAWGLRFLSDDRTPLGQPEISETPPGYRGYHSQLFDDEGTEVLVEYQWEQPQPMDAVRLHPAKPDFWDDAGGYGFPQKFILQALPATAVSGQASTWLTIADQRTENYPNPANNDITFWLPQLTPVGKLRLRATLLAPELASLQQNAARPKFLLALSEMRALRGGFPLAGPASISSSSKPLDSHWGVEGLVDGYTSTGKIIGARRWASDLSQRRILVGNISRQEQLLDRRVRWQNTRLGIVAGVLIAALLVTVVVNWTLSNRRRVRAVMIDRERIANDLHDEVGGALGSISLLSQKLRGMSDSPEQQALLDKVHAAASEAQAGVREAVWAAGASSVDNKTFEKHLHTIAERMLPDCDIEWQSNGSVVAPTFAPRKQHHFGMFFREAIHNIQKHAKASTVTLRFQWNPRNLVFIISDDGEGLHSLPASCESFRTLRYRAEQLPAKLTIESDPSGGTRFTLTTPLT